jgi:hypothetical protein
VSADRVAESYFVDGAIDRRTGISVEMSSDHCRVTVNPGVRPQVQRAANDYHVSSDLAVHVAASSNRDNVTLHGLARAHRDASSKPYDVASPASAGSLWLCGR